MRTTKKLYQWDTDQKLVDCDGKYVDYPIGDEVYRIEVIDKECIIPDELLQVSGTVKVYECMEYGTVKAFAFYINPRPMPPDYVFTPTQRLTFEGLVKKVDETIEDLQKRAASGEFNGSDYVITESDYDAIAAKTAGKLQPTIGELARTLETEKTDRERADISLQKDISGKLSEPAEGLAVGKYFRVAQIDENGHAVLEAVDAKSIGVQDVKVAGASVVADGVANVPNATNNTKGVIRGNTSIFNSNFAVSGGSPYCITRNASDFYSQGESGFVSNGTLRNVLTAPSLMSSLTADEQAAARERMAVENGNDFELLADAVLEEEANIFKVTFPKPVRECLYHIWFFNNNGENTILLTQCLDVGNNKFYMLKYSSGIKNAYGFVLNGYFRHNGKILEKSIVGYAAESSSDSWTYNTSGNGNVAYMNCPTGSELEKVDGIKIYLNNSSHVLNAGAVIKVWGR